MHILRVLGSRLLPCGCFVGRYEMYDGATVEIVDEVGAHCDAGHMTGCGVAAGDEMPSAEARSSRHSETARALTSVGSNGRSADC